MAVTPAEWPLAAMFQAKQASPMTASARLTRDCVLSRSRNSTRPSRLVKNTWVCISTEARAAVMPSCSARKSRPNCPNCARPAATSQGHAMRGRRTISTSGNTANT